jgi:transposase InsO family protein
MHDLRQVRDRDASYGHAVIRRLAAMGIRDHPTSARSPWQNGHAERLIGSIRRECLDHIVSSATLICVEFLLPTRAIATSCEHFCRWTKIHQPNGRFNGSFTSPRSRSLADIIIITAGHSFG